MPAHQLQLDYTSRLANLNRPEATREWCLMGELGWEVDKALFISGVLGLDRSSYRESRPIVVFS